MYISPDTVQSKVWTHLHIPLNEKVCLNSCIPMVVLSDQARKLLSQDLFLILVRVGQLYFQVTMTRMILINIPSSSHAITSCVLTTDPVRGFFLQCSWPSPPIPHATISFFPRRCKLLVYTLTRTLWSHVIVLVCHPKMFLSTTHPLRSKSSLHWLPLCCRI